MRFVILATLALVLLTGMISAPLQAGEQLYVSGGPALRYFERSKKNDHDRYWGNFIDSVLARHQKVQSEYGPEDQLTWMIFRPGYESRGREEKMDLIAEVEKRVASIGARLIWFSTKQELLDYVNQGQDRERIKIRRFEYFGHSNKRCFMFDYSNVVDGAVIESGTLHVDDLKNCVRAVSIEQPIVKAGAVTLAKTTVRHGKKLWASRSEVPSVRLTTHAGASPSFPHPGDAGINEKPDPTSHPAGLDSEQPGPNNFGTSPFQPGGKPRSSRGCPAQHGS
ncbi:MAG: hypothetical protein HC904_10880 [Blastochloris sp.]|nr:hypothetical protein [Blastochloris sp.]